MEKTLPFLYNDERNNWLVLFASLLGNLLEGLFHGEDLSLGQLVELLGHAVAVDQNVVWVELILGLEVLEHLPHNRSELDDLLTWIWLYHALGAVVHHLAVVGGQDGGDRVAETVELG